ncbi:MAG: DUF2007 domain-containing protein [Gemmataceae bacterium]|nr:DUF2007 domain-containing protein [Gemmataceae bacterium]MCS7271510.1 DUF2007 domain-containing protein [Gemmataceae bacterium]MDW8244331.1 DUF2007 domain-containing protein [Thermogemmata sp.]
MPAEESVDDIVKIYAGPYVTAEIYQQVLQEAGIEARVVGEELLAGFGSAIPDVVEVWVHRTDAEKARAAIQLYEQQRGNSSERPEFPRPTDDPLPRPPQ